MAKNEITKKQNGEIALAENEALEMFGESTLDTNTELSFNQVKIMRESAQFDCGQDEFEKTLKGHILFKHKANQWWEIPFDERKEGDDPMPNCYSVDGVTPSGGDKIQNDLCATCPRNKFGSGADGNGKACRNTMRFLFLPDDAVLPVVLSAPPTSLGKKGSLQQWLNDVPNRVAKAYNAIGMTNAKGGPIVDYWPAHVELSLEKEKFNSGMEASVLKIKTVNVLVPDSDENANKLRRLFEVVRSASEAYENERHAYIENEQELTEEETPSGQNDESDDIPF